MKVVTSSSVRLAAIIDLYLTFTSPPPAGILISEVSGLYPDISVTLTLSPGCPS